METQTAYCRTCDHPVRFTWTDQPSHEGQANLHDAELVCLDFDGACTSPTCPLSGMPNVVMGVRLARSGLKEGPWPTLRAPCEGCGTVQEQEVLDASYAFCPACGTTNRWIRLETEDAWVIALAPAVHGIPLPGAQDVPD